MANPDYPLSADDDLPRTLRRKRANGRHNAARGTTPAATAPRNWEMRQATTCVAIMILMAVTIRLAEPPA